MDKAPAYGAGDSGFESQYGLITFSIFSWYLCFFVSFLAKRSPFMISLLKKSDPAKRRG